MILSFFYVMFKKKNKCIAFILKVSSVGGLGACFDSFNSKWRRNMLRLKPYISLVRPHY